MLNTDAEQYTRHVERVLKIDDITSGGARDDFLVRYRGKLYGSSIKAYDDLAASLRTYQVTPLFREENGKDTILLKEGTIEPQASNPLINLVLFLLTLFSMIFAGTLFTYSGPVPEDLLGFLGTILTHLRVGIPFAISLLAILMAHEFGHYLAGRYHKTHVTLPYFIPFPLSPFGTMGAFIRLKEPPRNKRILLDIGIAGPLAGFVVAVPVLLYGLSISTVEPILLEPGQGIQIEGNSILYLLSQYIVFGQFLPIPSSYEGLNPFIYWVRYFFTGQPTPIGGFDVMINPIAWAGWAGLLVTALNLIPAGQLDGGHISYSLFGNRTKYFLPFILVALVLLGFVWSGWWLWAFMILLLGRVHAQPLDSITQLDPKRKVLAWAGLILFLLVFTPVPLMVTIA